MTSPLPQHIEIGDSVIFQKLRDESVLLNLTSQTYYGLDDVGTRMWNLLLEHGSVEPVVRELQSIYDADEAMLRRDVNTLVGELLKSDLLRPGSGD